MHTDKNLLSNLINGFPTMCVNKNNSNALLHRIRFIKENTHPPMDTMIEHKCYIRKLIDCEISLRWQHIFSILESPFVDVDFELQLIGLAKGNNICWENPKK